MANIAPLAPTLTGPDNNGYVIVAEIITFEWVFNDPGDYQIRADFRYKKTGDTAWTTANSVITTKLQYAMPAGTWVSGTVYEWQISTMDSGGLSSPWSPSRFLNTMAAIPAATITTPTAGTDLFSTPVPLAWTLPVGFVQEAYQVRRESLATGDGIVYYDSGEVVSTVLAASVPLDAAGTRTDYLRVRFRASGQWSLWASVGVDVVLSPPAAPTIGLTQTLGLPEVDVVISNAATAPSRVNLCTNPSAEIDLFSWTWGGGGSSTKYAFSRDTSAPISRTASAMTTRINYYLDDYVSEVQVPTSYLDGGWLVLPGQPFTAAVTVRGEQTNRRVRARIRYFLPGVSGSYDGYGFSPDTLVALPPGVPTRVTVSVAATPARLLRATLDMIVEAITGDALTGERVWFDDILAGPSGAYFDGDTPSTSTVARAWTGEPHKSASIEGDPREPTRVDLFRNGVRIAKDLPPNTVFKDCQVGAGLNEYLAVVFAANGASTQSASRVEVRRNLTNSARGLLNWAVSAPVGGTNALSLVATGAPDGGAFVRSTFTSASTASSGGLVYASTATNALPLKPGPASFSVQARSNRPQRVYALLRFYDAANLQLGAGVQSAAVTLEANTWTTLLVTDGVAPAGATHGFWTLYATTGGVLWANTDTLDAASLLVVEASTPGTAFDGDTPDDGELSYEWVGALGASASIELMPI